MSLRVVGAEYFPPFYRGNLCVGCHSEHSEESLADARFEIANKLRDPSFHSG
jgi:hypothetical protein